MNTRQSVVYTQKKASFTIDGTPYDVASVTLALATNGIPTYTVGISAEVSKGEAQKSYVHTLSLKDLAKTYQDLQKKALILAACNLEVELEAHPQITLTTKLDLKEWLLTYVGMSHITTTNSFALICTVSHPAYRLTLQPGCIYTGIGGINFSKMASDPQKPIQNPLEAAEKAIELVKKANDAPKKQKIFGKNDVPTSVELENMQEMRDKIAGRMDDVKKLAEKYLKWDTNGAYVRHGTNIPGAFVLKTMVDGIKYSLLKDWTTHLFELSYWDALCRIGAEYGYEVLSTYDQDALVVCPALPWKDTGKSTISLPDQAVYSVLLPGQDTTPIFGYIAKTGMAIPAGGHITVYSSGAEKTTTVPAVMPFIPRNPENSTGRITHVRIPDWITSTRQRASQNENTKGTTTNGTNYSGGLHDPASISSGDNKQLGELTPGIQMHLENYFQQEYKKGVTAVLSCPFFTAIQGKTLFPGQRLKFITEGQALFYGTVRTVHHAIDCATSSAETQITLSHCTFVGGADAAVIGKQPVAPYYAATGSLEW